jgi:hypothetical protein
MINRFIKYICSNREYFPKTDIINQKPTSDELQINHVASLPYQTMYIMADLSDITQSVIFRQSLNEYVLCRIHIYSNGTIVLEPDFNTDKIAYLIKTKNFNNDIRQYYVERASISISMNDLIIERRLYSKGPRRISQTNQLEKLNTGFCRAQKVTSNDICSTGSDSL